MDFRIPTIKFNVINFNCIISDLLRSDNREIISLFYYFCELGRNKLNIQIYGILDYPIYFNVISFNCIYF